MSGICRHKANSHLNTFLGWHSHWFTVPEAKGLKMPQHLTAQVAKLNLICRTCVIRMMYYSSLPQKPVSGGVLEDQEEAKFGKWKLYCKNTVSATNDPSDKLFGTIRKFVSICLEVQWILDPEKNLLFCHLEKVVKVLWQLTSPYVFPYPSPPS